MFWSAQACTVLQIDRKKILFIAWFPWASLTKFSTLFAWFAGKRRWRRASNRNQRLRKTLGGSSWCPPRQLRSCRTSLLRKASVLSAHLCPSVPRNLKFYTAWNCIPSCTSTMYTTEERKWDEARDGSIPMYLGCSIANGQMAKKKWNAECDQEKEIVDTNLSTRQMPQDTFCRDSASAVSWITHLSNMQTRNHEQARFACSKLPRMLCMVVKFWRR